MNKSQFIQGSILVIILLISYFTYAYLKKKNFNFVQESSNQKKKFWKIKIILTLGKLTKL